MTQKEAIRQLVKQYGFSLFNLKRWYKKYKLDMIRVLELCKYSMQPSITIEQLYEIRAFLREYNLSDAMQERIFERIQGYNGSN